MTEEPHSPASARAKGSYAKGLARRQEILDRAIEVFARRGAERTSLRSIAAEIGVSHAALSHYFHSREELLVEVYLESSRQLDAQHPAAPDSSVVEIMTTSAARNREVPGLVQLYSTLVATALEDGHPYATEFATTRFARIREELAENVRRRQEAGRMRRDMDPDAVAALVIAASDGLQTQWLLDPDAPQEAGLRLLERLLRPDAAE